MRDKKQKFARGATISFDRDNLPSMYGGKQKFPLRSLKQSTFKLFLG